MKKVIFILTMIAPLICPMLLHGQTIKRNVLAVYEADEVVKEGLNYIHKFAEMPLEHLGFKLTYVDVSKKLPTDAEMVKYDYIISWFSDNVLPGATKYIEWLTHQLKNGKKLVAIGDFGFYYDGDKLTPDSLREDFYKAFNIEYKGGEPTTSPLLIQIVYDDPKITEFERKLAGELTYFENMRTSDRNAKIFLQLKRRDTNDIYDAIFVHNKGAHVGFGYSIYQNPVDNQTRWKINPFEFFKLAFRGDFPKPDVTTINGMRLFYSHVDGDGIRSVSEIKDDKNDEKKICGKIAYENILTKFHVPVSVSVVIGDIFLAPKKSKDEVVETVKKIFALPNVEPASHGWAHPFVWEKSKRKMAMKTKGYEYSPQAEIGGAIEYMNEHFVPPGKKVDEGGRLCQTGIEGFISGPVHC